jgi:hypothetical protein
VVLSDPATTTTTLTTCGAKNDVEEGQITLTRGAFSKGEMKITGISAQQNLVKSRIDEFSDKKVSFI